jgi:hypothetical protein
MLPVRSSSSTCILSWLVRGAVKESVELERVNAEMRRSTSRDTPSMNSSVAPSTAC